MGKRPCSSGNQVAGLGQMESARSDEQNVVCLDHPVLGRDAGALDQRQQVALHALARDVGAAGFLARRHLVDFIDEDDAVLLGIGDGTGLDVFLVDHLGRLLIGQQLQGLGNLELARLALSWPIWLNMPRNCSAISSMPWGPMI